jgi:exopolyphosphatase/guanosine-5'-triphosphate,3'-diphosphate pyrophosphatase
MSKIVATIDCGSNSFHLLIAECHDNGSITVLHKDKQQVKLRAGLTPSGDLDQNTADLAINTLKRFAKALHDFKVEDRRFVGTYTLRALKKSHPIFFETEAILGRGIDVLTGKEEAKLIYLGSTLNTRDKKSRLHLDIGGGSTELIMGQGKNIDCCASMNMGCVDFQDQFFHEGDITQEKFDRAAVECRTIFKHAHFPLDSLDESTTCYGSSGTIQAISSILKRTLGAETIEIEALYALKNELIQTGRTRQIKLPGLRPDRRAILPGGVSILLPLFELLQISSLKLSSGALREGLLASMRP